MHRSILPRPLIGAVVEHTGVKLMVSNLAVCMRDLNLSSGASPTPYQLTLDTFPQSLGLHFFFTYKIAIIIYILVVVGVRLRTQNEKIV